MTGTLSTNPEIKSWRSPDQPCQFRYQAILWQLVTIIEEPRAFLNLHQTVPAVR